MTARLTELLRSGVRLDFSDPDRPIFRVSPGQRDRVGPLLTPDQKAETQRVLRHAAQYRQIVLRIFTMTQGETADVPEARAALQQEHRLTDELGVPLADLLRAQAAEDYTARTRLCPLCGGVPHDRQCRGDGW